MTTETKHTPTPWQVSDIAYVTDDGDVMYQIDEVVKHENANFIVRACNSHDALVEALKDMASFALSKMDDQSRSTDMAIFKNAKEALKLAGAYGS